MHVLLGSPRNILLLPSTTTKNVRVCISTHVLNEATIFTVAP